MEALAVRDGRILAVGGKEEILRLAGPATHREDLGGQVAVPGFHDSHLHLLSWGLTMDGVQLSKARSVQELVELGRAYVQENPGRQWILGRGFNDELFTEARLPTRADLDQISLCSRWCSPGCAGISAQPIPGPWNWRGSTNTRQTRRVAASTGIPRRAVPPGCCGKTPWSLSPS